ncbi:ATP-binding protein [candidate division KSB1 bacterium]|nr:ATP-binding protein [candidate division KSB1 bacterium]
MTITIASGKGGTGKTAVTVNLAKTAIAAGHSVQVLDADVEAPNLHLFLRPTIESETTISARVPRVDETLCTCCGRCAEICEYNAIGVFGSSVLVFPELCHACGGCALACPEKAITEFDHPIGTLRQGAIGDATAFVEGRLRIGEAKAPPIIRQVKKCLQREALVFIDAPPGNSCPAVEAMKAADYIILVSEPTPFGLYDLRMTVDIVRQMKMPYGLIINKVGLGNRDIYEFSEKNHIDILAEIPFRRDLASAYAAGEVWVERFPELRQSFSSVLKKVTAAGGTS